MDSIPVTVIGGYLGAGKTTLLNNLLRQANGERIAVLVNDFGDLGIDADLIESREQELINLAGGCVCCSIGSDLLDALERIATMQPAVERLLIETSGVALPLPVAQTATLVRGLVRDAVIVACDAQTLLTLANDRYLADTISRQVTQADVLVLGKRDLAGEAASEKARQWLTQMAPGVPIIEAVQGEIARELLLGPRLTRSPNWQVAPGAQAESQSAPTHPDTGRTALRVARELRATHTRFDSLSWLHEWPVDLPALLAILGDPQFGVIRAKGFVTDNEEQRWLVQQVGQRTTSTRLLARSPAGPKPRAAAAKESTNQDPANRSAPAKEQRPCALVMLGLGGQFAGERLRAALDRLSQSDLRPNDSA